MVYKYLGAGICNKPFFVGKISRIQSLDPWIYVRDRSFTRCTQIIPFFRKTTNIPELISILRSRNLESLLFAHPPQLQGPSISFARFLKMMMMTMMTM